MNELQPYLVLYEVKVFDRLVWFNLNVHIHTEHRNIGKKKKKKKKKKKREAQEI